MPKQLFMFLEGDRFVYISLSVQFGNLLFTLIWNSHPVKRQEMHDVAEYLFSLGFGVAQGKHEL